MPYLTVIAGPNGSGKTTLTSLVREAFQDTPVLDPDARVKLNQGIQPEASSLIEVGREVLVRANELLQARQSFVVETTLSGNTYLRMMRQAKALDYTIVLMFVGTQSVEINLQRVRERVASGGHDVPEADQRRRYPRSMGNLRKAYELADEAVLFDNSGRSHRRFVVKDTSGVTFYSDVPDWAAFLKSP